MGLGCPALAPDWGQEQSTVGDFSFGAHRPVGDHGVTAEAMQGAKTGGPAHTPRKASCLQSVPELWPGLVVELVVQDLCSCSGYTPKVGMQWWG